MLLILALNLFEADETEYAEIIQYTEKYVKTSFISFKNGGKEENPDRALTRAELARLMWWASTELEARLCRGETVTIKTVSDLFGADALSKMDKK